MKNDYNNSSFISDFLNSINIVDVVQNYINVSKKGQNYWALCPFHADKNPSLSVSQTKHIFKCFVCNTKGNAINFVMLFKKCSFIDALKEIKTILNIDNPSLENYINNSSNVNKEELEIFEINKKAAFFYHRTLFNKESEHCLNYLKSRNIDENIIDFYELGFTPKNTNRDYLLKLFEMSNKEKNGEPYLLLKAGLATLNDKENFIDFFFDRLIIPIKNEQGYIVGFSGRSLNKNDKVKYLNTKTTEFFKKENILFNFFSFDKSSYDEIYVVEGYMDVFAFKRLGIHNVVASMGTAFTANQINLIKKFPNVKRIILCLDNDSAGINATISLSEKLIKNNFDIFVVKPYDSKYKDIDELTRNFSQEECLKLVNNQIGLVEYKIETLKRMNLSYKEK
ncbi:MAG: DNA primase, partial [Malacoplasma sp.]|nr:DNA primase [Malacoplasma sp.]